MTRTPSCRSSSPDGKSVPAFPEGAPGSDIFQAHLRELAAHVVNIQPQLAGGQTLTLGLLIRLTRLCLLQHHVRIGTRHDAYAVIIRDDHIARIDQRIRAHDRNIDRSAGRLYRALRMHRLRSAELRVGKGWISTCRIWGAPVP